MSAPPINRERFDRLLKEKLGSSYSRALTVFENWGEALSWDVANVLRHAADQGKIEEVLSKLETHWEEHLKLQHPDVRGRVTGSVGVNPTQALLLDICERVLQLQPSSS
ncbi:hypothetical protein IID24_04445 [Patescibacteria group bacterium]|nr:hypothetical protein [Patescibacteria group bacterium]